MLGRRRPATTRALGAVALVSITFASPGATSAVTGSAGAHGASPSSHVGRPASRSTGLTPVDRAGPAGISGVSRSYGTYVADFDRDGDKDFLYNRHFGNAMRLYRNNGFGRFTVRSTAFPVNDRHDCAWANLDRQKRPDLYCTVGATHGALVKANELWLQRAGGGFRSVPGAWGARDRYGRGRVPALFDVNRDGLLDLFVGNHFPRPDGKRTPNRFYVQRPRGKFNSAPRFGISRQIGGQCAEPMDFDRDRFTDLVVCAYGRPGNRLKLYRNIAGREFRNVASARGINGQYCDAMWVDLNTDGRPDLTMMNRDWFQVMLQRPDRSFRRVFRRDLHDAGCQFGAGGDRIAAGDVNRDGAPDLYVLRSANRQGASNLQDWFFINNGRGTAFTQMWIPQPSPQGSGFSVARIQADRDRPIEFLVTNGRNNIEGPIQLIHFAP